MIVPEATSMGTEAIYYSASRVRVNDGSVYTLSTSAQKPFSILCGDYLVLSHHNEIATYEERGGKIVHSYFVEREKSICIIQTL